MALVFEAIYTPGIAQISYLVGDKKAGVAAVIDPRRDIEPYLAAAWSQGVRITHTIETHIHADFVSGTHELAARTGAAILGGRSTDYGFPITAANDGHEIRLGSVTLRVLHTPGHTPEHICLTLSEAEQGPEPFAVFTGDTLFNLDVGRPDLLGGDQKDALARALYRSLFQTLLPLGDRFEVFPCHGAGSACGKSIGDRRQSSIGNERLFNSALKEDRGEEGFSRWLLEDMPPPPRHYARLKQLNARGAPLRGGVPEVPPLAPKAFLEATRDGQVIDCRSILAFGGGHVPGSVSIALADEFPAWAGSMIDAARPVWLVAEDGARAKSAAEHLYRIGVDDVQAYLLGGMTPWQNAGLSLERVEEWTVHELDRRRQGAGVTVLDVRNDGEFEQGHVPGAMHLPLLHLEERIGELDPTRTIATFCGSGYRASIAASLLQRRGLRHVANVPGSWQAWKAAKLPVEKKV